MVAHLTRKRIIDKNGRTTTVFVKQGPNGKLYSPPIPPMPEPRIWFANTKFSIAASQHASTALLDEAEAERYKKEIRRSSKDVYINHVQEKIDNARHNLHDAESRLTEATFNNALPEVIYDCSLAVKLWVTSLKTWEDLACRAAKRTRWKSAN